MDARPWIGSIFGNKDVYRRPALPLLIAFAAGIFCGEQAFLPRQLIIGIIGLCLAAVLWSIIRRRTAAFIPLILFYLLGWLGMNGFAYPSFPDGHVTGFCGQTPWTITGIVIDTPAGAPGRRILYVAPRQLDNGRRHIKAGGHLRVTVYGADGPEITYGDQVRFQSRIRRITNFKNPGRFDYERYMAFQKVFGMAYTDAAGLQVLSRNEINGWRPAVERIRDKIGEQIDRSGHGRQIGVLKALVIGRRTDLDPAVRATFARAGVSHLLAISGLHVGIVAGLTFFVLAGLLAFMPFFTWQGWVKKGAALGTLPVIVAYGLLAGMSPSTQRAVIMAAVFLAALVAGRRHQLMNTLAVAALIILAAHPPSLYAVSFQLSFAAVFFILIGMDAAEERLVRVNNRWLRRCTGFVLVSFFAVVGTAPLTARYFNQVSWAGLPANCVMIPLVGFGAVPLGLTGAAIYGISPDLSLVLFKTAGTVIWLSNGIAAAVARLPGTGGRTVTPDMVEIICYYALAWTGVIWIKHGRPTLFRRRPDPSEDRPAAVRIAPVLAVLAVIALAADTGYWIHRRWLHHDLRVTVLDVGQGNAALVELPGGRCLLVDGGGFTGSSTFDVGERIVAPFLWQNKIGTVDTIVLTHPDTDHLEGLIYIADHFHVKTVWSNSQAVDTENYRRFLSVIRENDIDMPGFARLKRDRTIAGVNFGILYPPADFMRPNDRRRLTDTNNNSLVIRISLGRISFLFPGDIMAAAERELTARAGLQLTSTVLMAPHHGSRTSSTNFFLSRVRPRVVVVSAGRFNRYHNPAPEVLERYTTASADVFRTDAHGAVIMSTQGKELLVKIPMAVAGDQWRRYP